MKSSPSRSGRLCVSVLVLGALASACGPSNQSGADARADEAARDEGSDGSVVDAAREDAIDDTAVTDTQPDVQPLDVAHDAAEDSAVDTSAPDAAPDVTGDAPLLDAAPDAALLDTAIDTAPDAAPDVTNDSASDALSDAGPMPLPAMCANNAECGRGATCDTAARRCVCSTGYLPCANSCCPVRYTRDVMIDTGGHSPELGSDAMGRTYVLYKKGRTTVRLATIAPDGTVTLESVAESSGEDDDADMAVAPDGTILVAVHQPGAGRSGRFTLFRRDAGSTRFTTMSLLQTGVETFLYDAAVSIGRAPGGDIFAAASARVGDGTMGLAMSRYNAALGIWMGLPRVLTYHGHSRSELHATDTGFFLGVHDLGYSERFVRFESDATQREIIAVTSGTIYARGDSAAALTDAGQLVTFTSETVTYDARTNERMNFTGMESGRRSDIDMAVDRDGNPAMFFHSVTTHALILKVRMPRGGWTSWYTPDAIFVPFPMSADAMHVDLERLSSGELATVISDTQDRVPMRLRVVGPS